MIAHGNGFLEVWRAVAMGSSMLNLFPVYASFVADSQGQSSPRHGHIIINSDGAWDAVTNRMCIGCAARDHNKVVLWVAASWREGFFSASEVEGLALLDSMMRAATAGYQDVIFEIDSADVVKAVTLGATFLTGVTLGLIKF